MHTASMKGLLVSGQQFISSACGGLGASLAGSGTLNESVFLPFQALLCSAVKWD